MRTHLFSVTKDDLEIQTFKGSGPGGQHRNKVETAVRVIHPPSGAAGESQSEKSQHRNKRIAFRRMAESGAFRNWVRARAHEIIQQKTLDQIVDEWMQPKNIRIEVKDEQGRWIEADLSTLRD